MVDYLIVELKRCYNAIDDLKWNHMQVLRERKDLRDSLSMAKRFRIDFDSHVLGRGNRQTSNH